MADVIWLEGFELDADNDGLEAKYQEVNVSSTHGPRVLGNQSVTISKLLSHSLGTSQNMYMGFGFYGNPGSGTRKVQWFDGASKQVYLSIYRDDPSDTFWTMAVYNGDDTLLGTAATTLAANTWYYLEWHVYFHGSAGTVSLRINESVDSNFPLSSKNTAPSGNNQADQFKFGDSYNVRVDDIYVTTDAFLGDQNVTAYFPNGDDTSDFSSTGGNNYTEVDDAADSYSESTYVYSSTLNHVDLYEHQNTSGITGAIEAIMAVTYAGLNEAGQRKFKVRHEDSVVESENDLTGTEHTVSGTATFAYTDIATENPDTSNPWTTGDIDDIRLGPKITL